MARFEKGQGKIGGRVKGTPNKTTQEIRDAIQNVLSNRIEQLDNDLNKMSPAQRWMILDKVTKYIMPALAKNDDKVEHSGEISINISYTDDIQPNESDLDPEEDNDSMPF